MKRIAVLIAAFACIVLAAGCERAMHDMYDQPRYRPLRPAPTLPLGASSQPLPAESVVHSHGPFSGTSSGTTGGNEAIADDRANAAPAMPYPITAELVRRGQERYSIYCVPCHSPVGDGDGRVAQRGFPHPPSYHIARLMNAPDRHFYDVITHGYGVMYPYADRVAPEDRWAIVAHIRALQAAAP